MADAEVSPPQHEVGPPPPKQEPNCDSVKPLKLEFDQEKIIDEPLFSSTVEWYGEDVYCVDTTIGFLSLVPNESPIMHIIIKQDQTHRHFEFKYTSGTTKEARTIDNDFSVQEQILLALIDDSEFNFETAHIRSVYGPGGVNRVIGFQKGLIDIPYANVQRLVQQHAPPKAEIGCLLDEIDSEHTWGLILSAIAVECNTPWLDAEPGEIYPIAPTYRFLGVLRNALYEHFWSADSTTQRKLDSYLRPEQTYYDDECGDFYYVSCNEGWKKLVDKHNN